MPNPLSTIVSAITGGGGIFDGIKSILSTFIADPTQKAQAAEKLAELQLDFEAKRLVAETDFATQQANVVIAEAKSDSWLAKNWRPITMLTFVFIIVWNYILVGTIGAFYASIHPITIPTDMWGLLKLGIGGYIGARTVEKVADTLGDSGAFNKGKPDA